MTGDPRAQAQRLVSGFRGYQIVVTACKLGSDFAAFEAVPV